MGDLAGKQASCFPAVIIRPRQALPANLLGPATRLV
jgi:hypothetical protein